MKLAKMIGCALLAAGMVSGTAQARDQFNRKEAVVVDPGKSYIFYRAPSKADVRFLREVTEAERAAWEAERADAYAEARAKYERKLARWARDDAEYRQMSAYDRAASFEPIKPDPVTPETFPYAPPELDNFVTVRAGPQFTKDKPGYSYLVAVEPGSYVLYGRMTVTPNGSIGHCLCMGSVRFEAKAGQIVDLGELSYPEIADASTGASGARLSHIMVSPHAGAALPARLAGLPVVPADFRAAGKLPNYFGVLIDRLAPVPGVLAYRRDEVLDLKEDGGAESAGSH